MSGFTLADAERMLDDLLPEIRAELARAHELHGGQHLPSDMGPDTYPLLELVRFTPPGVRLTRVTAAELRDAARKACEAAKARGVLTWRHVLLEELFELLAESPDLDEPAWHAEGVQVANTVVRALTDHRTSEGDRA